MWSPYHADNAPVFFGQQVGLNSNNFMTYVGRGNYDGTNMIGRLQIEEPAGVYVTKVGEHLAKFPEYLVVPKGCKCDWAPFKGARSDPTVVTSSDKRNIFLVGRKEAKQKTLITRISNVTGEQTYTDHMNIETSDKAIDVLVCQRSS